MHLAVMVLALDGESVDSGSKGLAVISIVSIACGYLFLAGLWFFVFRDKSRSRRRKRSPKE